MIGLGLSAFGSILGASAQASAMSSAAAAQRQRAEIEAQWANRRALEERSAAQTASGDEMRKARYAQSKLTAMAGASGSGVADPTVMDLFGDIEQEGRYNAGMQTAAGEQRAAGLKYQADLGRWQADADARIKEASGRGSLISGILGAAGSMFKSPMASRYSWGTPTASAYRYG